MVELESSSSEPIKSANAANTSLLPRRVASPPKRLRTLGTKSSYPLISSEPLTELGQYRQALRIVAATASSLGHDPQIACAETRVHSTGKSEVQVHFGEGHQRDFQSSYPSYRSLGREDPSSGRWHSRRKTSILVTGEGVEKLLGVPNCTPELVMPPLQLCSRL
ncbi:hypothetical protein GWK47_039276 [Chionoecetes opilio]|uniref:Uncharacterized protein n=1 Tax=Chionoecetes opilio TaxID=41210 RepID=A0A8J4YBP3_CHIOP|nr:hypothetical protein GWK47_039276 [Chionoecetes opilio]